MNIWMHKCKKCERSIDLQKCPYCRELKKGEKDEKIQV